MASETDAHIYYADTYPLFEPEKFDFFYQAVSEYRKKKTDRLLFQKDKCLSLGAEILLIKACRDYGTDYPNAVITLGEHQKPEMEGLPFFFNLSHSEQRVMCVTSRFPVGCDVERRKEVSPELAKRFFFADEVRILESCSSQEEREATFFRLWTLKESFMKCTGLGFHLPLDTFSVSLTENGPSVSHPGNPGRYFLAEGPEENGYASAWCLKLPEYASENFAPRFEKTKVDFSQLIL